MPKLIGVFAGRPGHFVGFVMLLLKSSIIFKNATRLSLLEGKKFVSGIRVINASGLGSGFPVCFFRDKRSIYVCVSFDIDYCVRCLKEVT